MPLSIFNVLSLSLHGSSEKLSVFVLLHILILIFHFNSFSLCFSLGLVLVYVHFTNSGVNSLQGYTGSLNVIEYMASYVPAILYNNQVLTTTVLAYVFDRIHCFWQIVYENL